MGKASVISQAVADVVATCLGPRAMLKMLLDPMGGVVITNDGNAILREIDVGHPAAKSMIELSRAQDEEVGDGTTSVIIISMNCTNISANICSRRSIASCRAVVRALDASNCDCSCILSRFGGCLGSTWQSCSSH